jgi:hypothetical protein
VVPAGEALVLEPGTPLELRLRDGGIVRGHFLGRALLDSSLYVKRFGARTRSASFAPFALGETLRVTLRDGREWILPFAGYGELALLLRRPDAAEPTRVPFELTSRIRRTNGDLVETKTLTHAFRAGDLPSAEALVLGDSLPADSAAARRAARLQVAAEDIRAATARPSRGSRLVGYIALGVLAGVIVVVAIAAGSSSDCGSPSFGSTGFVSGMPLTTRPFDLDRKCYAGEALAVADPWAAPVAAEPPIALAEVATAAAPPR